MCWKQGESSSTRASSLPNSFLRSSWPWGAGGGVRTAAASGAPGAPPAASRSGARAAAGGRQCTTCCAQKWTVAWPALEDQILPLSLALHRPFRTRDRVTSCLACASPASSSDSCTFTRRAEGRGAGAASGWCAGFGAAPGSSGWASGASSASSLCSVSRRGAPAAPDERSPLLAGSDPCSSPGRLLGASRLPPGAPRLLLGLRAPELPPVDTTVDNRWVNSICLGHIPRILCGVVQSNTSHASKSNPYGISWSRSSSSCDTK